MKKKYRVVGIAPTHWQKDNLAILFGQLVKPWGSKYGAEKFFETKEDALDWMYNRNKYLFDLDYIDTIEYDDNSESIKTHSVVSYEDVYLKIEVVEGDEQ